MRKLKQALPMLLSWLPILTFLLLSPCSPIHGGGG